MLDGFDVEVVDGHQTHVNQARTESVENLAGNALFQASF